jgi:translation elongation factor EF-G
MDHPISVIVTRPAGGSQRDFAVAARHYVEAMDRVIAEVAPEGLILRGVTDIDLECAFHVLKQHFEGIHASNPKIAYEIGPPLQEPYYRAIVDTPEECLGSVMVDMADRRGMIQVINESPIGKRFVAEVPVAECFGYSTVLRRLTKGRGTYLLAFSHYGKVGGDGAA